MFLFWENHIGPEGTVLTTDCICSSHASGIGVNWKSDGPMLEAVNKIFKTIPLEERIYNPKNYIWTFIGGAGARLLTLLFTAYEKSRAVEFIEIEDLQGQIDSGGIKSKPKSSKFDPKKFFYNHSIVSRPALTRETVIEPLAKLLAVDAEVLRNGDKASMKSAYRKASLLFHPDRNNGDGSKMSELNMYWSVYA